jgi:hypothetical protein
VGNLKSLVACKMVSCLYVSAIFFFFENSWCLVNERLIKA